jgi:hypothetical protein
LAQVLFTVVHHVGWELKFVRRSAGGGGDSALPPP